MEDLAAIVSAEFDIVYQPVSTCYVRDIGRVYREVARVTRPGGIYISQHKQPASLQGVQQPGPAGGYELREAYYRTEPLPPVAGSKLREEGTAEFLHRWEELVGGLCRTGFIIEDLEALSRRRGVAAGHVRPSCQLSGPLRSHQGPAT